MELEKVPVVIQFSAWAMRSSALLCKKERERKKGTKKKKKKTVMESEKAVPSLDLNDKLFFFHSDNTAVSLLLIGLYLHYMWIFD